MNIMQLTDVSCAPKEYNHASGTNRVVAQLSEYFVTSYHDNCYLGYFTQLHNDISPFFSDSHHFIPTSTHSFDHLSFALFLTEHHIEVIQINFFNEKTIELIPSICEIAHQQHIKVIRCFHFMPGFEGVSHGSLSEVWYNATHCGPFFNKMKKWLITINKPLSTHIIWHLIKTKYENTYDSCDKIVVFTEQYVDKYLHIAKGCRRDKFAVIPNPLSFNEFLPVDNMISKKKEVIMVSRMQESQKRVSLALKIWEKIEKNPAFDEWSFTLIGNGQDEKYLHWLAKQYQLKRVQFEGRQDSEPYYERAAIFISTAGYEGWPMVLMEAMPMGCCCLSFDTYDAIHDIIEDGYNGYIIPDNDINRYGDRLMNLMLDDEKRTRMGLNAIESSHRFSMDKIGKQWHDLFEDCLKENKKVTN